MTNDLLAKYGQAVPRYTSYPTAPHFHAGVGPETYEGWLQALPGEAPLSLYLHIPYCDTLCWFCGCHTKLVRRYDPVADYLEVLLAEIDLLAERLGPARRLAHLHFGGGSPTILRPEDVARISEKLYRRFRFARDLEFSVEIDPRDIEPEAIQVWARAGMNRASIGVQDFDPEVQQAVNRIQSYDETAKVLAWLRAAGIKQVNIDLMYGLPHQTLDRVLRTVRQVIDLAPDRLALFGYAHVPWMKRHQRLIPKDTLPGAEERLEQSEAAARLLIEAGYRRIGLDHFARPGDPLARAQESGSLHRNFQGYTTDAAEVLIGLGASAIGRLPQGLVQNAVPVKDYGAAVREGRFAVCRGLRFGPEDHLRGAVIERLMCDLTVDLAEQARLFGAAAGVFAPELSELKAMAEDGLVELEEDRVRVTETGRPFLRSVCALFDSYLTTGKGRHAQAV